MAEKRKVLRVVDEQGNLEQVLFETSAEQVKVVDEGNYYSGDNSESVFQEIGEKLEEIDEKLEEGVGRVDDVVNKDGTSLVANKIAQVTPQNIGAIPTTEKGVANGVAQLDGSAKIPTTQLPDFLMGQVLYGGNVGIETQPIAVNSVVSELYFDTSITPDFSQLQLEDGTAVLFTAPRDTMGAVALQYIDFGQVGLSTSAKALVLTLDDRNNQVIYSTEDFSWELGGISGTQGWNVNSYDLGRAVTIDNANQTNVWSSWVSGVDATSSGGGSSTNAPIAVGDTIDTLYFNTSLSDEEMLTNLSAVDMAIDSVQELVTIGEGNPYGVMVYDLSAMGLAGGRALMWIENNAPTPIYSTVAFDIYGVVGVVGWQNLDENGAKTFSPRAVYNINDQDLWGAYISKEPFTSGGGTPIIATLSNNAINKLGVANNSLNITNDTTDKTGYVSNEGIYYIATTSFKFAGLSFKTGDWLISTGNAWTKIDNTDAVTGVKGNKESVFRTGNVIISPADIGLGNVDNTADRDKSVSHATTSDSATTATSAGKLSSSQQFSITGDVDGSSTSDLSSGVSINVTIGDGKVTKSKLADVFSTDDNVFTAVSVDRKGRVVDGGSVIEWGTSGQTTPSANLMVGGLFFELQ